MREYVCLTWNKTTPSTGFLPFRSCELSVILPPGSSIIIAFDWDRVGGSERHVELSVPRVHLEDLKLRHNLAAVAKNGTDCPLLSEVSGFIGATGSVTSPAPKHGNPISKMKRLTIQARVF
jgi:hypothetical protein